MTKITRTIDVPFTGCDRCRYLDPITTTLYAARGAYVIFTKCSNENLCKTLIYSSR